jgi:hypothetical protein
VVERQAQVAAASVAGHAQRQLQALLLDLINQKVTF